MGTSISTENWTVIDKSLETHCGQIWIELKTLGSPVFRGLSHFHEFCPQEAHQVFPVKSRETLSYDSSRRRRGGGNSHFEIYLEQSVLNKAYCQGNCFTSKKMSKIGFYQNLPNLGEETYLTQAPISFLVSSEWEEQWRSICKDHSPGKEAH